ncbi:LPS export ABC transporter permease LptG [Flagellatimonas centrodinii]|uniref:LPS export ABC transporter permease LptG n=1 Tax=Flagellatimonas centrodinii TaxID=2806210 RepID=UPI001FEFC309|nr:LPS export ABC transporter permease LptG [Flagellatimonas centrodinii]ULQ45728.1 LPS export ABC transporter permease LptG [Flagellatimonas centrodinii]
MKRYDRYISRHVLGMSAIVALVLIALFSFISFVSEVDDTGRGGFGLLQLGVYTVLMMPSALYTLFPVIALLGTLAGLGVLASQGELTALRAAGVSSVRLGGSALAAGLVMAVLTVGIGDWLAPWGQTEAERLRTTARSGVDAGQVLRPVWLRAGSDVLHIRRIADPGHLEHVDLFRLDGKGGLTRWARVDEMVLAGDDQWDLRGLSDSRFDDRAVTVRDDVEERWDGRLSPEVLRLLVLEAESASIAGLMRLVHYLEANALDAGEAERALWRKLMAPFTVLAMTFFAVPFVFGSLRDSGMGQRLFFGVLIGVGFFVINEVSGSLGQLYGWPPLLGAGAPSAVLVAVGFWRLRRAR